METPAYDERASQGWQGTKAKPLGYGIMRATGKNGETRGWIVSVLAQREHGKAKYTALQDIAAITAKAYAKVYNPYTGLYKTEVAALKKAEECAKAFNGYLLRDEQARIDELTTKGEYKTDDAGKKANKQRALVDIVNERLSKSADKWGLFIDTVKGIDCVEDRHGAAIEILELVERATQAGADSNEIEKILAACVEQLTTLRTGAIEKATEEYKKATASK